MGGLVHLIITFGYLGLFVGLALEYLILVVPGETLLTTMGVLSRSAGQHHFNVVLLILATGLGTFTGSMVAYAIGRLFGRPVLYRYGKYVFLTQKRIEQSERLLSKRMILTLIVSKYIAVVRDIVPYIAGIHRVQLRIFVPISLVISFAWTATFIAAGGLLGQLWSMVHTHWRADLLPMLGVVLLLGAAYWYLHKRLHRFVETQDNESSTTSSS